MATCCAPGIRAKEAKAVLYPMHRCRSTRSNRRFSWVWPRRGVSKGIPKLVCQRQGLPNRTRPAGLIQRYREELQARPDTRRTLAMDEP